MEPSSRSNAGAGILNDLSFKMSLQIQAARSPARELLVACVVDLAAASAPCIGGVIGGELSRVQRLRRAVPVVVLLHGDDDVYVNLLRRRPAALLKGFGF